MMFLYEWRMNIHYHPLFLGLLREPPNPYKHIPDSVGLQMAGSTRDFSWDESSPTEKKPFTQFTRPGKHTKSY